MVRSLMTFFFLVAMFWADAAPTVKLKRGKHGLVYAEGASVPFTGVVRDMHPGGKPKSEANYRNGRPHGRVLFWHPNGKKRSAFNYLNGRLEGIASYWYDDGAKQVEATYRNGLRHGSSTDWWPNGNKSNQELYEAGRRHGKWREWWPDGSPAAEEIWNMGRMVSRKAWERDGTPKVIGGRSLAGGAKLPRVLTIAQRVEWRYGSGDPRIDLIYRGKPASTLFKVFGDPIRVEEGKWVYTGLRILDPTNGRLYTIVKYRIKENRVAEVWVE